MRDSTSYNLLINYKKHMIMDVKEILKITCYFVNESLSLDFMQILIFFANNF